jgi:transposase InsO family protein
MRHGITIGMDGKGRCFDNIFVERLWRSLIRRGPTAMLIRVWPMPGPVSAQSVMWRPGKMRFLIGMKKPASYSAGRDRQTTPPLAGPHRGNRRQLRRAHCTASPGLLILRQEK